MEFNKINNLLGPAHDEVPRFITEKWIEVQSQLEILTMQVNQ